MKLLKSWRRKKRKNSGSAKLRRQREVSHPCPPRVLKRGFQIENHMTMVALITAASPVSFQFWLGLARHEWVFLGVKHIPYLRKSHEHFKATVAVRKFHNHTQQTECWTLWKLFSVNGALRNRGSAKCWQIMVLMWLLPFKDLKSSLLDVEDEIDNELTNAGVLADRGTSSSSFKSPTRSDSKESKYGDEDDLLQNG